MYPDHSAQAYCERLSTSQLQALLREECAGRGDLPEDLILVICDILAQRDPSLPTAKQILLEIAARYLP